MIVTTIPVIFPLVKALGYDPIWFGVIVTMLVEIAHQPARRHRALLCRACAARPAHHRCFPRRDAVHRRLPDSVRWRRNSRSGCRAHQR
jgi:hypothetical protein